MKFLQDNRMPVRRLCVDCEHYGGGALNGPHCFCVRDPIQCTEQAQPAYECAYWTRAIGADDETPPPR